MAQLTKTPIIVGCVVVLLETLFMEDDDISEVVKPAVGLADGAEIGIKLGLKLGLKLGKNVGNIEGIIVGIQDGPIVG
jgi:hypothetical protein